MYNNTQERILVYGMSDNMGGIEAYVMNVYRHLDKSKIMFDFIVDFPDMAYADEALSNGSQIYKIPAKGQNPLKHLIDFFKILKNHKEYKTVYFNILNAGAAFSMIVPFVLRRCIVTHSHSGSDENLRLHNFFKKPLNVFTKKRFACSEIASKHMFGDREDVTIINNAIDIDRYTFNEEIRNKKRQELGLNNELTLLHVGRMGTVKNPLFMIDILSEILKIKSDTVFLYAGSGPMEDEIKQYASENNITDKNLKFLGMRTDINELMQAADVFLLPSLFEGLPVVGIEAQAADLQCLLSDAISQAVKITEKVNFLSINENPEVWVKEILSLDISERGSRRKELTDAGYNVEREVEKLVSALN